MAAACGALPEEGEEVWLDTRFDAAPLLPLGPRRATAAAAAATFFDYLRGGLLPPRRPQERDCRCSWAFALTGALQSATALAYARRGLFFDNLHMSLEYLLSCYERCCGCRGADLCVALLEAQEKGVVTFRQFPYVSGRATDIDPFSSLRVVYRCTDTSHNGTCPPCDADLADYTETGFPPDATFVVPCVPCVQPAAPRYFPVDAFRVADPALSLEERVAAVKAELLRLGPLCAALDVADEDAFRALQSAAPPPLAASPHEGVRYRPTRVGNAAAHHSVLVVGYHDAFPSTGRQEDREAAFWVCRTPWPGAGYRLRAEARRPASGGAEGFVSEEGVVDGFVNVSIYGLGGDLVDRALSFERVAIRVEVFGSQRELGASDPLVLRNLGGGGGGWLAHLSLALSLMLLLLLAAVLLFR
jgi:hypothetical protein